MDIECIQKLGFIAMSILLSKLNIAATFDNTFNLNQAHGIKTSFSNTK